MEEYQTIIPGGPYIVVKNKNGGVEREIGWATLKIKDDRIVHVFCNDSTIGIENVLIFQFQLRNAIPPDYKYYENIKILFTLGYNTNFAYNFSYKQRFQRGCEDYFTELDKKIDKERIDRLLLESNKCDKCNGSGITR